MRYLSKKIQDQIESCMWLEIDFMTDRIKERLEDGEFETEEDMIDAMYSYIDVNYFHDRSRETSGIESAAFSILSDIGEDPDELFHKEAVAALKDLAQSYPWNDGKGG